MSPRPPKDDPKANQYRLRMTNDELGKLEYCCEKLNMKKSEVILAGIEKMYERAKGTSDD